MPNLVSPACNLEDAKEEENIKRKGTITKIKLKRRTKERLSLDLNSMFQNKLLNPSASETTTNKELKIKMIKTEK